MVAYTLGFICSCPNKHIVTIVVIIISVEVSVFIARHTLLLHESSPGPSSASGLVWELLFFSASDSSEAAR